MKITCAGYKTPYGNNSVLTKEIGWRIEDYVQMTEFIEVDFPDLTKEMIVCNQINAIDALIDEEKDRALLKMGQLNAKKQELLAITHQV